MSSGQSDTRNMIDHSYNTMLSNRIRWRKTLQFIQEGDPLPLGYVGGLDIGDRTEFTGQLEKLFEGTFGSTNVDLDVGSPEVQISFSMLDDDFRPGRMVVTCFEVIEHLFNPLHCLLEIKKILHPNGRLYLSTPKFKPHILWDPYHYHEMSERSIMWLIDRAGFDVVRRTVITNLPWWFYFTGFRPLLRALFHGNWLFELKPRQQVPSHQVQMTERERMTE